MTDQPKPDAPADDKPQADPQADPPPPRKRLGATTIIIAVIVALAGVLLILFAWRLPPFATPIVTTQDSYVRGKVTVLSSQVSGYVAQVLVPDYAHVRAGDVLVRIDDRTYRAQVAQDQAKVEAAQADLDNAAQTIASNRADVAAKQADVVSAEAEGRRAGTDARRISDLASRGSVSVREKDQAVASASTAAANLTKARANVRVSLEAVKTAIVQREQLAAQVRAAKAALQADLLNLSKTVIAAPRNGQVGEASVREGQYVMAGSQLINLVPPELWVIANFKETQVRAMRAGQAATFEVDALDGARLHGRVEIFSPATGSEFSVLRPDNATGNFTKVVQRLPIRLSIDPNQPLADRIRPGMSVITRVDTTGATGDGQVR
ncbi:HlyD family secretion protein [Sphingomonas bacterium]|uniref:HlyD family secretion protein n=1 Tax=Sphingomonas bacterium TaxID=1895847 RepID=UPI001575944D|nr:HlyD family secretion protein [Sphingomonas bacterium]